MPTAYSVDLRVRILHDCRNGMKYKDAAKKYAVSLSCVYNFCQQYKDTNNIAPKEYKRGRKQKLAPYEQEVQQLIAEHPDLNPIEMVFSKLKALVRKLKLRNVSELWHKLGELCDVFAPQECKNYFRHTGYKNIIPKQT